MFKSITADEYLKQRIDQSRDWYDAKAVRAKAVYMRIRVVAVVGAVLVPVLANIHMGDYQAYAPIATTVVSLLVSIAVALDSAFHFGDQWKNYRSTEQFLSREKFLFQTGEGPYKETDGDRAFILLVERCEAQISAENSATLNVIVNAVQQRTGPSTE